jgi:hypothetical protein
MGQQKCRCRVPVAPFDGATAIELHVYAESGNRSFKIDSDTQYVELDLDDKEYVTMELLYSNSDGKAILGQSGSFIATVPHQALGYFTQMKTELVLPSLCAFPWLAWSAL